MRTWEEEDVIHCSSAIWMRIGSSFTGAEAGDVGRDEIRRAKGTGEGEVWGPVCPR